MNNLFADEKIGYCFLILRSYSVDMLSSLPTCDNVV